MATAQAMEEELQQSVLLSEDAEYETADSFVDNHTDSTHREGTGAVAVNLSTAPSDVPRDFGSDDEELSDRDASGEEIEEDASGEEDNDPLVQQIVVGDTPMEDEDEDEDEEDDDAEGDDDLGEGVGAVKIKPGDSDPDEDADSEVSELPIESEEESDEDVAWKGEDAGDDDESDTAPSNTCIFCKQDEENDPSEDFEAFLTCTACGENAHQQCARDAAAMTEKNHTKSWKCPECFTGDSELDDADIEVKDGGSGDEHARSASQLSEEAKLAQEPNGSEDASTRSQDDHNVNGARSLRKRGTSSAETDELGGSLRKRRRNLSAESSSHDDTGADAAADSNRGSRVLRLKAQRPSAVTVERKSRSSLVLKMMVRPGNLKEVLARRKRDKRRPGASRPAPLARTPAGIPVAAPTPAASLPTPFTSDLYSQPFYSFFDKETDDAKGKPYGGILNEAEADTSKTLPNPEDRKKFDQAKQKAEDEWRARVLAMQAEAEVPLRKPKKVTENASQIECIEFGGWEIDTWYAAPYPAEYSRNRVLYICEFCLKYMNSDYVAWRHKLKCATKHPPGDEIYRHESVSIFEVDGRKHPVYCQNLCLLAKLFLGSKTLYYDVEPFLFYILCEYDERGYHFVGYFSKEKRASSQNNVSCILTLPIHQRKGYGNLLIDFSYLLTKTEQKTGSPEKPLSDMGLVSYRNYWRLELCKYFLDLLQGNRHKSEGLSVKRISDETGMTPDDVVSALEGLRALVRDPQTQLYAFRVDTEYCRQYVAKWESKGYVKLKPEALAWTPYIMGRSNAVNFELGPPISTIAPREEEEVKPLDAQLSSGAESQHPADGDVQDVAQRDITVDGDTDMTNGVEPVKSIEKVSPDDKENAGPQNHTRQADAPDNDSWSAPYQDIPPTRFEVFPPITGGRRADRIRPSVTRPVVPRPTPSASRPRRSGGGGGGSARRPAASRPRSSTSRRKTGGTGRGPGRWPKGTKKSDYGNADSGPGLPPGWKEKQARLRAEVDSKPLATDISSTDKPAKDEVQVFVATASANGKTEHGDEPKSASSVKTNGQRGSEAMDVDSGNGVEGH